MAVSAAAATSFLVTLLPATMMLANNLLQGGMNMGKVVETVMNYSIASKDNSTMMLMIHRIDENLAEILRTAKTSEAEQNRHVELPLCCVPSVISGEDDCILKNTKELLWTPGRKLVSGPGVGDDFKFRLKRTPLKCKHGFAEGRIYATSSPSSYHFTSKGMLKYRSEYYRNDEFCVKKISDSKGMVELNFCKVSCSDPETPCVHKCCDLNSVYSLGASGQKGGCSPINQGFENSSSSPDQWSPIVYDTRGKKMNATLVKTLRPHYIHRAPSDFKALCPSNATTVYPYSSTVANFLTKALRRPFAPLKFRYHSNGWLSYKKRSTPLANIAISQSSRTKNYCMDGVQNYGETKAYENLQSQMVLFLCVDSPPPPPKPAPPKIIPLKSISKTITPKTLKVKQDKLPIKSSIKKTTTNSPLPSPIDNDMIKFLMQNVLREERSTFPVIPSCCKLNPGGKENGNYCDPAKMKQNEVDTADEVYWTPPPNFMTVEERVKFRLEKHTLACDKEWDKIFLHGYPGTVPKGLQLPKLLPSGEMQIGNEYFKQGEYCINGIFKDIVEVLKCRTDCSSSSRPCIKKCCAANEIYSLGADGSEKGCVPNDFSKGLEKAWEPVLYETMEKKVPSSLQNTMTPHMIQNFPPNFQFKCYKNLTLVFPYSSSIIPLMKPLAKLNLEFKIRKDGKIIYNVPNFKNPAGSPTTSVFESVEYCVDGIRNYGEDLSQPYKPKENETILFVCAAAPQPIKT